MGLRDSKMLRILAAIAGVILMILGFLQWIAYSYPEINITRLGGGGVLAVGPIESIGLFVNWLLVCVLGASGWGLLSWARKKPTDVDE